MTFRHHRLALRAATLISALALFATMTPTTNATETRMANTNTPPPQTQGEPGPQAGNCNQPGKHKWTTSGGTDSLLWEEEVIDNNCVLTLVSGTVPDHGGTDDATGVPWTGDTIDRVTVNDDVKLAPKGGRLLFSKLPSLTNADVTNLDTKNAEDLYAMFWTDPKLTEIDGLDHWDTSNVTNMQSLFNATGLTKLDLSSWNTSKVTNMNWTFYNSANLKTIGDPGLDIPAGANQSGMYDGSGLRCSQAGRHHWTIGANTLDWQETTNSDYSQCTLTLTGGVAPENPSHDDGNTGVPWANDSTVTKLTVNPGAKLSGTGGHYLFSKLPSLTNADVTNLDTKNAEDLYAMFWTDPKLTEIDGLDHWDTSNVTNMQSLFNATGLTKLDLSSWNTSKVTNMNWTFYNSANLKTLDLYGWDTSQVTDTTWMLPPNLKALRLGPKTKLINGAFTYVAPPAPGTWTDKSGLTNPAWTGNTSALASRAAGANHEGTYILDGQANPFPPVNTPVSALPFTGDKWQTMVKGLMLLLAAGLVLGIVTYARAKRVTSNK